MKSMILCILILLIIGASVLFINPGNEENGIQTHSSQLVAILSQSGNTERTDFYNENGQITTAADLRYATVLVTKGENYRLEEYFDENSQPTKRYSGEWAVLREYDEQWNNIRNTSLDADGNPILNASGYAIEEREYNLNRQVTRVSYFDENRIPVNTLVGGFGKLNLYDENSRISQITYIDAFGKPIKTSRGYAIQKMYFYELGEEEKDKIKEEYYFDENGNPVALSLGEYGIRFGYDECERASVLTYLDHKGRPITTTKGYSTIVRTFQENNYPETERYFDVEGNPCSLTEGQYGVKRFGNQTIYLDVNGNELFNLKNLLYNHGLIIILFALISIMISAMINRKWNVVLLIMYIGVVIYLTLLFREKEKSRINLQVFWSYQQFFTNGEVRADILKNIWLFIPLGAILFQIYPKSIILLTLVGFSIVVEIIQFISGTGLCEIDDIISNSIGGGIGYYMGKIATGIKMSFITRKQTYSA